MSAGPGEWTAELVASVLIEAYRRGLVLYCEGEGELRTPEGGSDLFLEVIGRTAKYFGAQSEGRRRLLIWARCRAAGYRDAEIWRMMHWQGKTAVRRRTRRLQAAADGLNADGIPVPRFPLLVSTISGEQACG